MLHLLFEFNICKSTNSIKEGLPWSFKYSEEKTVTETELKNAFKSELCSYNGGDAELSLGSTPEAQH